MLALMEVPGDPEMGLLQVMLAEHGPGGVITLLVVLFVWKVAIPGLNAAGKMARDLFDQHLKQGAMTLDRLSAVEAAIKANDAHTGLKLDGVQKGLETFSSTATAHLRIHDREIESLKGVSDDHAHRIRGLELHAGNSGVYQRPRPPPQSTGD